MIKTDESYCRRCYRLLSAGQESCFACSHDQLAGRSWRRGIVLLGTLGFPVLIVGLLTLGIRLCVAGAAISGVAALLRAVLSLQ
jgi:hypothetical protein